MTSACGSCLTCSPDYLRHHSVILSRADLFFPCFFSIAHVLWLSLLPLCMATFSSFHIPILFLAHAESQDLVSIFRISRHRNGDFRCRVWASCCISPTELYLSACRMILSHSYSCGCVWVLSCCISACRSGSCGQSICLTMSTSHTHDLLQSLERTCRPMWQVLLDKSPWWSLDCCKMLPQLLFLFLN